MTSPSSQQAVASPLVDAELLVAVRAGRRAALLLGELPPPLAGGVLRRWGVSGVATPAVVDRATLLGADLRPMDADDALADLVSTWAATVLPAFLAAPADHALGGWRGALLCRVAARHLGEPWPAARMRTAADRAIANAEIVEDVDLSARWRRYFGLRDARARAEMLGWRAERAAAALGEALRGLADTEGEPPMARWAALDAALGALVERRDGLAVSLRALSGQLGVLSRRVDGPPPPTEGLPTDAWLADLEETVAEGLAALAEDPQAERAFALSELAERLEPLLGARDAEALAGEAHALAAALAVGGAPPVERVAPLLSALAEVLVDGRALEPGRWARVEESLSGRTCRALSDGALRAALEGRSQPPPAAEPSPHTHRPLEGGGASPLLRVDEARLRQRRAGVDVIIGSPALGLDRVWRALRTLHADGPDRVELIDAERGASTTLAALRLDGVGGANDGAAWRPVVRRAGMPLAELALLLQLVVDGMQHPSGAAGFVRPVFLIGPEELLALRRGGVLDRIEGRPEVTVIRLRRWGAEAVAAWQAERGRSGESATEWVARTGGWPSLLESLDAGPAGAGLADDALIGETGVGAHPGAARFFGLLIEVGGPAGLDALRTAAARVGLRAELTRPLIDFLLDLDLVISEDGALSPEPVAARLFRFGQ